MESSRTCPIKCKFLKQESTFRPLPTADILFARVGSVLINRGLLPSHTQHMTMTILKSSIPSHGIDDSKNQFHNGIDFSQGFDSVESMPELKF
jgi:hypothetical protein